MKCLDVPLDSINLREELAGFDIQPCLECFFPSEPETTLIVIV